MTLIYHLYFTVVAGWGGRGGRSKCHTFTLLYNVLTGEVEEHETEEEMEKAL